MGAVTWCDFLGGWSHRVTGIASVAWVAELEYWNLRVPLTAIPTRVLEVECTLTRLVGKDMLCKNTILLNFAILCHKLWSACFHCICCWVGKQSEVDSNMVTKVCNQGVCPVRVFCPLNIRGTCMFGSIRVNVLLQFCTTFLWMHHDVGDKGGISHTLEMATPT